MTTSSWSPTPAKSPYIIDANLLQVFIQFSEKKCWNKLPSLLTPDEIKVHRALMTQSKETWFKTAEQFSSEQLLLLVRFFTLAEMQFNGWQAAEKSPVIWITKVLRQRKNPLPQELLVWIKSHSDNQFLPNGAL